MWARAVQTMLGVWLMAAPAVLDYGPPASLGDRIVGPLVISVSYVAIWQVLRGLRWVNIALGVWLLLAPWVLGYELVPLLNSLVVGLLVVALTPLGGKTTQRFSGGWSSLLPGHRVEEQRID